MDEKELQTSLTHLHQELSTLENVDESTKAMLATVMDDIHKVLAGEAASAAGEGAVEEEESDTPGSDRLRSLVADFEAEHPKLAQTLGQLADGLANLGI